MNHDPAQCLTLTPATGTPVAARLLRPADACACYVLAPGAGAGMQHPAMLALAQDLASAAIATLRFQFPYMERGSRRPDPPSLCHATVRAAVAAAAGAAPDLPLFAGGRSFGGRMTSQAQSLSALPALRGLVFLGFPLHPAATPGIDRAAHLDKIGLPMLFVQGTRDALAQRALLEKVLERLQPRATLHWVQDADHSFHVPARSGRSDQQVRAGLVTAAAAWMRARC